MAEGGDAKAGDTARNDWFGERVAQALHVKSEKFKKLLLQEEGARPLLDFMLNPDITRVFVAEGAKDLTCFEAPPTNLKKKAVYFLKIQKVAITAENAKDVVMHGDLSPGVLQHLFDTTSEVYLPLLSNVHNQSGLPEVVVKDVMEYYHRLVAAIYVTSMRIPAAQPHTQPHIQPRAANEKPEAAASAAAAAALPQSSRVLTRLTRALALSLSLSLARAQSATRRVRLFCRCRRWSCRRPIAPPRTRSACTCSRRRS